MIIHRSWLGEDASLTETEAHYVLAWPGGYKVIDLTDRDQLYAVLSTCVHDLMVGAYQQGYTKGSGDGYSTGFHDATRPAAYKTPT
jgi:hypothetical protein